MHTRARGGAAEALACLHLRDRGFRILETNYRCPQGELDLIAEDDQGVLCFIEVRSRARGPRDFGTPIETIGRIKRARIVRSARWYIAERNIDPGRAMRFDVIGLTYEGNADGDSCEPTIEVIQNAFEANE